MWYDLKMSSVYALAHSEHLYEMIEVFSILINGLEFEPKECRYDIW